MVVSMIKICSLDLLNKENFETDVMTADRRVLYSIGEKITPEIILKLYFKEIYVEKTPIKVISEESTSDSDSHKIAVSTFSKENVHSGPRTINADISEGPDITIPKDFNRLEQDPEAVNLKDDFENQPLEFDEEQAKKIVSHSLKLGKILNFSEGELKELEQVAYYCNIGITNFRRQDALKKGFRRMKAFIGYDKLISEKIVSVKIAEMVKVSASNYESETFSLDAKIPYNHIVAITSYYEELLAQNASKELTLLKMLQIGGNQFNIFVLHKFLNTMKE